MEFFKKHIQVQVEKDGSLFKSERLGAEMISTNIVIFHYQGYFWNNHQPVAEPNKVEHVKRVKSMVVKWV